MGALESGSRAFVLVLTLVLVNWRAATPAIIRLEHDRWDPVAGMELLVSMGLAVIVLLLLVRARLLGDFLRTWRRDLALAGFGAFAGLSILWSISPSVSLYKWGILALATLVGSYVGYRLKAAGMRHVFYAYGAFLAIASLLLAVLVPFAGRMYIGYDGAWRGVFWHRNHMGTLLALFSVFTWYRLEAMRRLGLRRVLPPLAVLMLQGFLVLVSRSATALLVMLAGGILFALAYLWQLARHRLKPAHYLGIFGLAGTAVVILGMLFRQILALLGRNAALSGRIPLWQAVLEDHASARPALGYGLGAFWNSLANRVAAAEAIRSRFHIEIGDNGWLDILLGVGGFGLALFLLVQLAMLARAFRRLWQGRDFADSLPLVFLLSALLANAAYSLFLETEGGVWLMLVGLHFIPIAADEVAPAGSTTTMVRGPGGHG